MTTQLFEWWSAWWVINGWWTTCYSSTAATASKRRILKLVTELSWITSNAWLHDSKISYWSDHEVIISPCELRLAWKVCFSVVAFVNDKHGQCGVIHKWWYPSPPFKIGKPTSDCSTSFMDNPSFWVPCLWLPRPWSSTVQTASWGDDPISIVRNWEHKSSPLPKVPGPGG